MGEIAGVGIVGAVLFPHQIQRHCAELQRGSALQEEHLIVVRNAHQLTKQRLCFVVNVQIHGAAVAHFHHAHALVLIADQFFLGFFQHALVDGRGTCRKIVYSFHLHFLPTPLRVLLFF